MKTNERLFVLIAVAVTACGSKRSMTQGAVTGEHLSCKAAEMPGRFDCATVLRDYFRANGDARIAGLNVIYGDGKVEALVWRTQNELWPTASALEIDNHECSPTSASEPGCATVIDDLARTKSGKRHYFIVPVYGAPDADHAGTWSVLDVHSASAGASDDAGWDSVSTDLLRCRLEPGQPFLADYGNGVMKAEQVGSDYEPDGSEYSNNCSPVLINYLRAHPEERIAGVVALDGRLTKRVGPHDEPGEEATVALMVLSGSAPAPKSSSLSVTDIPCIEPSCAKVFAELRPQLKVSPRVIFTVPIGDERNKPIVNELLVISLPK